MIIPFASPIHLEGRDLVNSRSSYLSRNGEEFLSPLGAFLKWLFLFVLFVKDFFLCVPFLKSLLNLLQYCFRFMFWLFDREACGMRSNLHCKAKS